MQPQPNPLSFSSSSFCHMLGHFLPHFIHLWPRQTPPRPLLLLQARFPEVWVYLFLLAFPCTPSQGCFPHWLDPFPPPAPSPLSLGWGFPSCVSAFTWPPCVHSGLLTWMNENSFVFSVAFTWRNVLSSYRLLLVIGGVYILAYLKLFQLSLLKIGRVFPLDPEHWEVGVYKEERVRAYPQGFTV